MGVRYQYMQLGRGGGVSLRTDPLIAAVTTIPVTATRNNLAGKVGLRFTPTANRTVKRLGRFNVSGNVQTHTVEIILASNGSVVATAEVDMTQGEAGAYTRQAITPVVLTSGTSYFLVSEEFDGGDLWHDLGDCAVSDGIDLTGHVYYDGSYNPFTTEQAYGIPNLWYA